MKKATARLITIKLIFAALAIFQVTAQAQDVTDKTPRPTIRVTGESTVTVKPDQAIIDVGVTTQSASAQTDASQNAQKTDAVIAEIRRALGPGADIRTISYSLSPNYRYPREGGQPTIDGYIASNIVQLKINDLTQVGKIIDLATQSGANNIQGLRFALKDEQAARSQALAEAATKARAKADVIAAALGLKIQRVLHVEEGGSVSMPPMPTYARQADMAAVTTPVEAGTIGVRALITLTLEVAQ